jgi:hypothetical protein
MGLKCTCIKCLKLTEMDCEMTQHLQKTRVETWWKAERICWNMLLQPMIHCWFTVCWNVLESQKKTLREVSITNSDQVLVDWSSQWKLGKHEREKPEQNYMKQVQFKHWSWNISSTRINGKRDEDTNHLHRCNEWFRKFDDASPLW